MSTCRQTRRQTHRQPRLQTRRQKGGDLEAKDIALIDTFFHFVDKPALLAANLYINKDIYNKCTTFAPKSFIGGPHGNKLHIEGDINFPISPTKKPLSTILRCAYNFFEKYAKRVSENWEMEQSHYKRAQRICTILDRVFVSLTKNNKTSHALFRSIKANI